MKFQKIINNATRNVAAIVAMYAIMRINSETKNPNYASIVTSQAVNYANNLMYNLENMKHG